MILDKQSRVKGLETFVVVQNIMKNARLASLFKYILIHAAGWKWILTYIYVVFSNFSFYIY